MSEPTSSIDLHREILESLREARRDLRATFLKIPGFSERVFEPTRLVRTLAAHVDDVAECNNRERRGKLFVLTTLLYGALDWFLANASADVEADVQLERLQQVYRFGGPDADERLSPEDWRTRMRYQVQRLEQELAIEALYVNRLIKLTALAQASLEVATRQWQPPKAS
jgi:hypothetical protein